MTSPSPARIAAEPATGSLALRAMLPGLGLAVLGTAIVLLSGRLPDGTAPFVAGGAATAALTGTIGVMLKARAFAGPRSGGGGSPAGPGGQRQQFDGQRLQIALFGDFVVQLFTIGGTLLAMFLGGMKFPNLVGFALAFAAVAVGHLFGSSLVLVRSLRRRAASGAVAGSHGSSIGRDPGLADPLGHAAKEATSLRGSAPAGATPRSTGSSTR